MSANYPSSIYPTITMSATNLKNVRAYCRSKYGVNWWDTDTKTKKSRKAEARLALSDDPEENIPLCDLVRIVPQKPKIEIVSQKPEKPTREFAMARRAWKKHMRANVMPQLRVFAPLYWCAPPQVGPTEPAVRQDGWWCRTHLRRRAGNS